MYYYYQNKSGNYSGLTSQREHLNQKSKYKFDPCYTLKIKSYKN